MATIYEVSKLAGVSLATVSRVMNKTANVSQKTKLKVEKAMLDLGYKPNSVAISLASKRSDCVGILVTQLDGMFFGSMMNGIESELTKQRKHLVITAGHNVEHDERAGIDFLKSRNCDALIIHAEVLSDEYLIELSQGDTPIYILNRHIPEIAERCIHLDNQYGSYLATKHVIKAGHTEVLHISGPRYRKDAQERIIGFKQAMYEAGLPVNESHIFEGDYGHSGGAAAIDYFMQQRLSFTSIVCANDHLAVGAMARLRDFDKIPGEQIAIMGFDDMPFADCTYPKLTTIRYPIREMGKLAADYVLKDVYKVQQKIPPSSFEPTLVIRDSVLNLSK
ncbi:LacI family DNA-binding transcriptional regulator [Glaciecola petra]|uniref:LacI family DNA-binding transcriptional regulator n=1 Tax=Glaciecola petra TaxID=3075602 RepID=A0ABU2ZS82_9ALTE|nr:LacI family DNA-binding transcriptional regulator [Aestuariibacter sp. P117]MDT0595280.1 LacI family DNA-binding transcriptional regulator [Aestuariibacter sp. P117]